jgi:hypothetical protein
MHDAGDYRLPSALGVLKMAGLSHHSSSLLASTTYLPGTRRISRVAGPLLLATMAGLLISLE